MDIISKRGGGPGIDPFYVDGYTTVQGVIPLISYITSDYIVSVSGPNLGKLCNQNATAAKLANLKIQKPFREDKDSP
jgi:hypothetical protein